VVLQVGVGIVFRGLRVAKGGLGTCCSSTLESGASAIGGGVAICSGGACDNPPRKVPYYRLRPIHFGH
jgi:hypothetical protein